MKESNIFRAWNGFKYNLILLSFVLILTSVKSNVISSNHFDNTSNVTVKAGQTAHLRCRLSVDHIGDNLVVWTRKRGDHILTAGSDTLVNDSRISTSFRDGDWVLEIKNVKLKDSGRYVCLTRSDSGVLISRPARSVLLSVSDPKQNDNGLRNAFNFLNAESAEQNINIQEIIDKAEHIIKRAEDKTGNLNPAVIVNEFLADPFPVKDFNISDSGGFTNFDGNLRNMTLHGLKRLEITNMVFNLGYMHLKVQMDIPLVQLRGIYDIDGKVTFVRLYGNGNFGMNVSDIVIRAYGALNRSDSGILQVGSIDLDVETSDINLNFENLMGGGAWSSITNSLLNRMSGLIFDHVKHTMLDEVSQDIKTMINQKLAHLPLDFVDEKSSNIFDDILEYSKKAINETGLDPFGLPPFKDRFNYNMLFFVLKGQIEIFEGRLYGLSTLIRTGDIIATYQNNEVTFEASLGFTNLTGGYNWATNVMGGGPSGSASLSLSSPSCYLRIKQGLKKGMRPKIDVFKIEQIKHLWIDVEGLGSWDFILEIIMNLVSNAFKLSLANAISGPVTHAIQQEINNMPISFL